jgi:hypothetical protein
VSQLEAIDVMLKAQELGPSFMMNIKDKLKLLGEEQFVELQTGPTPWWNTRLYLVAALAHEFGRTRGFVFVDGDGKFLLAASPSEICHRLALRWPPLAKAYTVFRLEVPTLERLGTEIWSYPQYVGQAFEVDEQVAKHTLSIRDLEYELGITRIAEIADVNGKDQRFLQREILGRQTPYVALIRDHKLEGLVDRGLLAQRVAQLALQ